MTGYKQAGLDEEINTITSLLASIIINSFCLMTFQISKWIYFLNKTHHCVNVSVIHF